MGIIVAIVLGFFAASLAVGIIIAVGTILLAMLGAFDHHIPRPEKETIFNMPITKAVRILWAKWKNR